MEGLVTVVRMKLSKQVCYKFVMSWGGWALGLVGGNQLELAHSSVLTSTGCQPAIAPHYVSIPTINTTIVVILTTNTTTMVITTINSVDSTPPPRPAWWSLSDCTTHPSLKHHTTICSQQSVLKVQCTQLCIKHKEKEGYIPMLRVHWSRLASNDLNFTLGSTSRQFSCVLTLRELATASFTITTSGSFFHLVEVATFQV